MNGAQIAESGSDHVGLYGTWYKLGFHSVGDGEGFFKKGSDLIQLFQRSNCCEKNSWGWTEGKRGDQLVGN